VLATDFHNDVTALIPILVLTKVADRHRRQALPDGRDHRAVWHQLFIGAALVGEVFALAAAANPGHGWIDAIVVLVVVVCIPVFAVELLRSDSDATT
jgi:hypothetical protein